MNTIWEHTAKLPHFDSLNGDVNTDVLIIGGGICGILCAYMLHKAGIDYILTEAEAICGGITGKTTAKITVQHGLIYDRLTKMFGIEKAQLYLEANQAALDEYRSMCENIDCDFEVKDSFVYSVDDKRKIEKEALALKKLGCEAEYTDTLSLPFPTAGAVKLKNQAQFDPLRFIAEISKNLNIREYTRVRELWGTKAVTDNGTVSAKKIIVTTHFPFINKHGSYFLKMYQHRSYVIAVENAAPIDGMYVDEAENGMSFRACGELLLIGGGSHRTGKKGGNWQELRDFAKRYYPDSTEKYCWATQDCMTLDKVPYIGNYSARTEDLYVATGFNKWGMTSSMVSALLLSDMVQGRENKYSEVFSPSRSILRPSLAVNAFEAVINLLTPATKRCPHLGCALKWNPYEHSWDCPCHGSRFTESGRLLDNPSNGDMKDGTHGNK